MKRLFGGLFDLYAMRLFILINFLFDHSEAPRLNTTIMATLFQKLEGSIQRIRKYKSLLQGSNGVGKTTTLFYIGNMARGVFNSSS